MEPRKVLLQCLHAAIQSVEGDEVVFNYLSKNPPDDGVAVVAIGKAAVSMWQGAQRALDGRIRRHLIITKQGHIPASAEHLNCMEAEHPLPGPGSLAAGQALIKFIDELPLDREVVFLISGGTSALVEVLPEGIELDDLQKVNQWLLASGLDIQQINLIRKRLSMIKAGRLAKRLAGRKTLNLIVSDVPGNRISAVGSGLLVAEDTAVTLPKNLPVWLQDQIVAAPDIPTQDDSCFETITNKILADNRQALEAAVREAKRQGFVVHLSSEIIEGDALEAGRQLAARIKASEQGIYLWGGETTVVLPPEPGRGGRNQSLALAAAEVLNGATDSWFLSAGTDGTDGPTDDAGALVDGGTLSRGQAEGLSAAESLAHADAGRFLEASGDLLNLGPTGTNVMDIIIGMKTSG